MPTPRRTAATLLLLLAGMAAPAGAAGPAVSSAAERARPVTVQRPPARAECRIRVDGPDVTADCYNPYPDSDHVQLHIECDRWWDPDVDTAPVEAGPAQTVRLAGRCWLPVREAWVSHHR